MKTINLFLLNMVLCLCLQQGKAQVVINTAEKFAVGETFTYWKADTTNFTSGRGGENVVWDFSNLQKLQLENSEEVLLPSQTQYGNTFPKATEVRKSQDNRYMFLERKSDSVFMQGFIQSSPSIEIHYTKPQLFAINPIKYGDSHIATTEYTYSFGNQNFIGGGFFAMLADGYGKLILDGKTYENVLRVRIKQDNADTIKPFNSIVSTTKITAYRWYNMHSGLPLLSVDSVVVQSQGGTQKSIEVLGLKKTYGAVGINEIAENGYLATVLYDKISISANYAKYINAVEVYDISGRLISKKNINKQANTAEIQLPKKAEIGQLYLVRIHTENKIHSLKLGVK